MLTYLKKCSKNPFKNVNQTHGGVARSQCKLCAIWSFLRIHRQNFIKKADLLAMQILEAVI